MAIPGPRFRVFLLLFLFLPLQSALAQEEFSKWEVGAQFTAIRQLDHNGKVATFPGLGGRLDWNFARRLAFETQVDFFPQNAAPFIQQQGGRTTEALFGVRAKALQTKRFAVFGLIRPGFFHFPNTPTSPSGSGWLGPANYFVLNLGAGFEYYPSPRWIARFDITGNPFRTPNGTQTVVVLPGNVQTQLPVSGNIKDTWRVSFGAGYRLGRLAENSREGSVSGRLELGPQFTSLAMHRRTQDGVRTEPGIGGFISYEFWRFLWADSAVVFFPRDTHYVSSLDGGRLIEGLFGLKGGIRHDRFGIFGKVRPGVLSASRTLKEIREVSPGPSPALTLVTARSNTFAVDLGGIVEIYTTKHQVLRLEAGDMHLYYHDGHYKFPDGTVITQMSGERQHTQQFTVGYGWRF